MRDRVMEFPSVTRNTLQLGCSRRYSVADVVINGKGVCGTTRVDSHCAGYILYRIIIYTHTYVHVCDEPGVRSKPRRGHPHVRSRFVIV